MKVVSASLYYGGWKYYGIKIDNNGEFRFSRYNGVTLYVIAYVTLSALQYWRCTRYY